MLKRVPQVGEHSVAGHWVIAPLHREPPGPSFELMRGPHQCLLVGPLLASVPRQVKLIRSKLRTHPLESPALTGCLLARLLDVLDLAHHSLCPGLDKRPAIAICVIHGSQLISGPLLNAMPGRGAG